MSPKRILLTQNNPRLATCMGEALAAAGFHVYAASDGPSALARMDEVQPDLVAMDVVLPSMDGAEVVRSIRASRPMQGLPVLVLPCEVEPLVIAASKAGATKALGRFANPVGAMVKAVEIALGGAPEESRHGRETSATGVRLAEIREGLPVRVAELRRSLHGVMHTANAGQSVRALFQETHNFAEEVALLDLKPVYRVASALEALVFDLHAEPMQVNPSTLRTIGQAIDLLAALLEGDSWKNIPEPCNARLLVVDDEANARHLITAALQLVDLQSISAATPAAGLEALRDSTVDVIILDVGLPEMSGFELCTKIRAIPEYEKTPILFVTGMSTFQNRVQSSLSGGNDFVGKPFNIRELGLKGLLWVVKQHAALP